MLGRGCFGLFFSCGASVVLGTAGLNRLTFGVLLVGVLLLGRRFRRAKGMDDLVPGESDDGLGLWRKLNGRRLSSGLLLPEWDFGFSFSSTILKLEAGGTVVSTFGKTEEGETLVLPPGKTDDREPPNFKLP